VSEWRKLRVKFYLQDKGFGFLRGVGAKDAFFGFRELNEAGIDRELLTIGAELLAIVEEQADGRLRAVKLRMGEV
jgi:cold shock CspA family protein